MKIPNEIGTKNKRDDEGRLCQNPRPSTSNPANPSHRCLRRHLHDHSCRWSMFDAGDSRIK